MLCQSFQCTRHLRLTSISTGHCCCVLSAFFAITASLAHGVRQANGQVSNQGGCMLVPQLCVGTKFTTSSFHHEHAVTRLILLSQVFAFLAHHIHLSHTAQQQTSQLFRVCLSRIIGSHATPTADCPGPCGMMFVPQPQLAEQGLQDDSAPSQCTAIAAGPLPDEGLGPVPDEGRTGLSSASPPPFLAHHASPSCHWRIQMWLGHERGPHQSGPQAFRDQGSRRVSSPHWHGSRRSQAHF